MARSLAAFALLAVLAVPAGAQVEPVGPAADTTAIGVRLPPPTRSYTLQLPAAFTSPWLAGPRYLPALAGARWQEALQRRGDSVRVAGARNLLFMQLYGVSTEPMDSLAQAQNKGVFGISRDVVDLNLDGMIRLEIRTDRLRNERCTAFALADPSSGCRAGFNGPRIDNQLSIRSGGVIGRRLRLNVDWDTQRDFSNTNNIQVYYQGLEDEIVQRVEVGSVAFRPPPSRFLTAALPTNNFGVNTLLEFGALQLQLMAATQKGSAVAERTFTVGGTAVTPQDRSQRDLDFEYGRFFWVVDPRTLPNYPAVDVLTLDTLALPAGQRPLDVRVYRYRVPQGSTSAADPNLGGIPACARQGDTPRTVGPVQWQLLVAGIDYWLDPSGLWVAMAQKVDTRADYLAVSYRRQDGTFVGSFPASPPATPGTTCATVDSLQLIEEPLVGSEQPSFYHEMRNFYRIAGQDLDRSSLQVNLTVNRSERPVAPSPYATYLSALGVSVPTDANTVDRDNRLFPRVRDPGADAVVREAYLVFPNLQPFADPTRLQPTERSDSLYRTPIYLLFTQGPPSVFQFRLRYNSAGAGDRSTLNLNALQVREGSEKVFVGNRQLERGVDYNIAYETGQVTFLNPDALFGAGQQTVTARFEERGVFAVAPTSIFGVTGHYDLGRRGAVNVMTLYQREQSAYNRPQLGFEAAANLIAGANAELHFKPNAVSRFLNAVLPSRSLAESFLDFNAEVAFSRPDPNRSGQAYLEEFEGESGVFVALRESAWEFGSLPRSVDGLPPTLGISSFDREDAVQLVWQNLIPAPGGGALQVFADDIDPNIETAGRSTVAETVMYLTLHADTAGGVVQRNSASRWTQPARPGRPRWRSFQTPLSAVGADFTRNEFIEFWVYEDGAKSADAAQTHLILDLGSVSEDAVAVAPTTLTVDGADSVYTGRQYVGTGVLDTERRSNGIFNAESDDLGILGDVPDLDTPSGPVQGFPLCEVQLSSSVPVYPWGDLGARCTRRNGFLSTEDLDGDNTLDARGSNDNVFRYVVPLGDPRFIAREGVQDPTTGAGWRLYRVPLRIPDATIGSPNLRLVQHLRMTVAAPDQGGDDKVARFALARVRFVGSPWVRRADAPIAGLSGSTAEPSGEVVSAIISTLDSTDLGYVSPPGVVASVDRRDQVGGQVGTQINEKSLRIIARGLAQGTRAEAYTRFPAGAQRFLGYRQLRLWMRGRRGAPGWESGELQGFVKVGSDDRNFYLYRRNLRALGGEEAWEPELQVDLATWQRLRALVEQRWLLGQAPSGAAECGGDPTAYVACEGGYLVQVASPGVNPPNLAAVQEIAAGVIRVGAGTSDSTEVWVDDVRLADPVAETGVAYALEGRFVASDVADVSVLYTSVDGQFRQIGTQPTFRTTGGLSLASNVRLDRFLPMSLGLLMPLTITYANSKVDPQLVTGTDIPGGALPGLRKPEGDVLSMALVVRRSRRSADGLMRLLVDPLAFTGALTRGNTTTELSQANNRNYALNLAYNYTPDLKPKTFSLQKFVGGLPRWLRESEGGRALARPQVNLMPTNIRLASGLTRDQSDYYAYATPINRPQDAQVAPTLGLTHLWRNLAGLTWQPIGMLTFTADYVSTRDLRDYGDTTDLARLASASRQSFLGMDVGVERDRNVSTAIAIQPRISSWLRPRFRTTSGFTLLRTLNSRSVVREFGDSGAFFLPQTYNNSRSNELGFSVDYGRLMRQLAGDSSSLGSLVRRFRPLELSWTNTKLSTFDLATFSPSLAYQLALGGFENFLSQGGERALGASDIQGATASTGLDFPFGLSATLNYSDLTSDRYQQVNEGFLVATVTQREWPSGALRFTRSFKKGPFTLLTAGAALRRRNGSTAQPSVAGTVALSSNDSRAFNPELQLGFRNGLNALAALNNVRQETVTNGSTTQLQQNDLTSTLSYPFRLPFTIQRQRRTARSTFSALFSKAEQCLIRTDTPDCQVISDTRRQEFRGSVDADVLQMMTAGLQVGYTTNELRHLDRKTSQIFFLLTFTVSLFSGDYR